jgi:hypothetical protein
VYSRHIANPALRKTFAFAFEAGPNTGNDRQSFQPDDPEPVKLDTKAGLVSLIEQSVCAIEFIGETLQAGSVQAIRDVRDERLVPTPAGRGWIELINGLQFELLGIVLSDPTLTRRAIGLLKRVRKLVGAKERATVSARDVEDGVLFLDMLRSRATPEARHAINIVSRRLKKATGQTVDAVVEQLAKSKPAVR